MAIQVAYNLDCMAYMRALTDKAFDLAVVDPPYGGGGARLRRPGAIRRALRPLPASQPDGAWKTTKPDTDNLDKALKDEMTRLHFWKDDAQVCSEISEKFWADVPGIFVKVVAL